MMGTRPMVPGTPAGVLGSSSASETVVQETRRLTLAHCGQSLRGLILTGSLARNEATTLSDGGRTRLLGDAEFMLVFEPAASLPSAAEVAAIQQRVEQGLAAQRILAHITLSTCHPRYLQRLEPHIFAHELHACGRVVAGDADLLSLVPAFPVSAIPLEDAWRLLANRLVEQLAMLTERGRANEGPGLDRPYRAVKLYLDMATSLLVFAGHYAPTYRERAERLSHLASSDGDWPFPLTDFAARISECTRLKLEASPESLTKVDGSEALSWARRLWRWELARLTGADRRLSDRELLLRLMRAQPLAQRLRGWLYVARRHGWRRGGRHWARWTLRALQGSPRYGVYAAASALVFGLPALTGPVGSEIGAAADLTELRRWLPVVSSPSIAAPGAWQALAADIVWNYHEFLVETRA